MELTRATSQRIAAGVAQLLHAASHLGTRVATDLHGDLPSFGWALLVPLEQDGAQRCSALAAHVGVDVSVVSRQVSALERAGFVERRPDPLDGRASLISLSQAGAAALAHTRDAHGQWAVEVLADWTEEEALQFSARLEELADGIDRAGSRRPSRPAAPTHPTTGGPDEPPAVPPAPHHQESRR